MLSKFVFLSSLSSVNCLSLYTDGLVSGHRSWLFTESVLTSSRGKDRRSLREGRRDKERERERDRDRSTSTTSSRLQVTDGPNSIDTALDDEYFIKKQRR
jgi:hypothetical protein